MQGKGLCVRGAPPIVMVRRWSFPETPFATAPLSACCALGSGEYH